ncbi:MAG: 16S rRNA (guanine(527)-N(7))-methyltransferase RsmG [Thermostichales cyanobacterium HHBFW_bins_127]
MPTYPHLPWQETLNWDPDAQVLAQFERLHQQLLLGNQKQNLTRLTDVVDFWEKHLWDSLRGLHSGLPLPVCQEHSHSLIDLGTGAGFPGIPIAVVLPRWQITLADATKRKIQFVQETLGVLGLTQVQTLAERAEWIGRQPQYRQQFDWALLRAVGPATVCAEYALPCLKLGGHAILYRGHWSDQEAKALDKALAILGGAVVRVDAFQTPLTGAVRHCLVIAKTQPTPPTFPRAIGIPAKEPLGSAPP